MFSAGDLIHIPQGVTMIKQHGVDHIYSITKKPEIGVFVKYIDQDAQDAQVATIDGSIWNVNPKKIFFNKTPEVSNACRTCTA